MIVVIPAYSYSKPQKSGSRKPNIIFILVDDMGWGDPGLFYQDQRKKDDLPYEMTPNLDKMGMNGAQLRDHYDAAPVCAPSRASILLGLSQGHANVRDNQFDKALEYNHTLGTVMQTLGYSTAAIGKWGEQGDDRWDQNGSQWRGNPLNRGFDYFLGYMRHIDGHQHYPKEGKYTGAKQVWRNHTDITPELDKCYTADLWTAAAKKWIMDHEKGANSKNPFFMYLAYDTPHAVLELPTQAYPKGRGLHGGIQWTGETGHMINTASGTIDSWTNPVYANAVYDDDQNPSTPPVPWPKVYKRYATDVSRIDNCVGDIMQLLEDLHIAKNTIVVFTSDNGPSRESYLPKEFKPNNPSFFRGFGPFDGIKRDSWEGGVRVPTLAYWPGHIPKGRIITSPSISYDWLATFTDAAGVPAPEESDGVSLLPEITGVGKQIDPLIYVEYYQWGRTPKYTDFAPQHRGRKRGQMQMIRMGKYVGVRYNIKSQSENFEIYDVTKDPEEIHNLAEEPQTPEMTNFINSLQKKMKTRVLEVRRPNVSAPRPYDGVPIPSVKETNATNGISWKVYDGDFPWVPQVQTLNPANAGTSPSPVLDMVDAQKDQIVCYQGYINIPTEGKYTFYLSTDTGAELRIHDATILDADYDYWSRVWKQGSVILQAGLHPFRLYYRRKPKILPPSLKLEWEGPHFKRQPIPENVFYKK